MSHKIKIVNGDVFGNLTIIEETEKYYWMDKRGVTRSKRMFNCLCSCGNTTKVSIEHLRSGHTKSCGCLQAISAQELNTEHGNYTVPLGNYKNPMLNRWKSMVQRCAKNHNYLRLEHSQKLLTDFKYFCDYINKELGDCPEGMSLDRKDNNLGYIEGNLRWATRIQQADNTRGASKVSSRFKGVCYNKKNSNWMATIMRDGIRQYIGSFKNEYDAARAYVIEWLKYNNLVEKYK